MYCLTVDGLVPVFKKRKDHPLYPGLSGFVAEKICWGEDLFDGSIRGIWEETKNVVQRKSIVRLNLTFPTCHQDRLTGKDFYFFAHMMLCLEPLENIILSSEHEKFVCVRPADIKAKKFTMIPDAREDFEESLEKILKITKNGWS